MLSRSGIFVVLLAGLVFTAADDSETERNVAELEVETLVSCVKFFSPLIMTCVNSFSTKTRGILFIHQ